MSSKRYVPGVTITSLTAMAFAILVAGILLHWDAVVLQTGSFNAEHAVPLPGIAVLIGLTIISAVLWRQWKKRLLSRAELLCVVFVMLIGLPLMTQGFWHRYLSITTTVVDEPAMFTHLRGYPDALWPHGENLLDGAFDESNRENLEITGNVAWEDIDLEPGRTARMPVLRNSSPGEVSSIRIPVDAVVDGKRLVTAGEPFLVSVLARPGVGPDFALDSSSLYYGRVHGGRGSAMAEAFATGASGRRTFSQKGGFRHVGGGNVDMPRGADERVIVEFALRGEGVLALTEPAMMSTDALMSAHRGKRLVTQSEFDQLPPDERGGLIVRPDSLWSFAGVRFLLSGYIPIGQWVRPMFWWMSFMLLLFLAALAINVLLRKHWMESERFQMPLTRIPMALMGYGPDDIDAGVLRTGPMPLIWRNHMMWAGLIVAFVWTLLRAWNFYNPKVPDLNIYVHLKPYFSDPRFGGMWDPVYFMVSAIFLSIAMFMELNVLLSIIVGFFFFRSFSWMNRAWEVNNALPGFPWQADQQIGAYIAYALVTLLFMRKYLVRVVKAALVGDKAASEGEALSYRTAFLLLIATFVLIPIWAHSLGASMSGVLLLFAFLVIVAISTSRLRTECGAPFGYLGPATATMVLALFGGIAAFGSDATLFGFVLSFLVGGTPFFLIPGAQMELLELGRRFHVRPRHLVATCVLGIVGGMVVGGWVFLSRSYAVGGSNMRYDWSYANKPWYFTSFHADHANATAAYLKQDDHAALSETRDSLLTPRQMGFLAGSTLTIATAVLRQIFPAFWFHPIGIMLGFNSIAPMVWGSCLVAYVLRLIVLHFGGAATVRKRLQPFFVGVFCGTLGAHLILMAHSAYLQSRGVENILSWWPFLVP